MPEPYLRNCWYQAGFADEIAETPVARMILDEPVVLCRLDGRAVALEDQCPHRFAPLSMGRVLDGALVCGYHGLAFGASGACVRSPHGPVVSELTVRTYPLVERNTVLWIWMGDEQFADTAQIPDLSFIDATPESARIRLTMEVAASYRLVTDNLMDLSHADFLHPDSLGGVMTGASTRTWVEDGAVIVEWTNKDRPAPARFHAKVPPPQRADSWTLARWQAPAVMVIAVALVPSSRVRRPEDEVRALHSMTPATMNSTHYFVRSTRWDRVGDLEYSQQLRAMLWQAFVEEDKPITEAQQRVIADHALADMHPRLMRTDAGAVLVRRQLDKRIRLETRMVSTSPTKQLLRKSSRRNERLTGSAKLIDQEIACP